MVDFAIELSFDAPSADEIEHAWKRLAFAGLPSQGDHARGMTNSPHVTLAVAQEMPDDAVQAARDLVTGLLPTRFAVRGHLVLGEGSRVTLAYLVEPELELTEAVLRMRALLPRLRHPVWTPHVTLARRVPRARVGEALAELAEAPRELVANRLRHWDPQTNSIETLAAVSPTEV